MRLTGEATAIEVQGVTFAVVLDWGDFDRIAQALDKATTNADVTKLVNKELPDAVKRIESLEDTDGTPLNALTLDVLKKLDPRIVLELWNKITNVGADVGQAQVPLVEPSGEKPEPS